ncbi:MAG: hypothetical protein M1814_000998 [Vezdaea aestivalis]|nr:MAG: hypothetical protein M1814_000998 [Vezdaea aestivalis]
MASTGLAVAASGLLYFKQNELIYPRTLPPGARTEIPRPTEFGVLDWEDLTIPTPDGERLNAFLLKAPKARAGTSGEKEVTVLMFHGNAGNIGHRVPIARVLQEKMRCNVLMVEYRGYGASTGSPGEVGLCVDAQTGLDYIRGRAGLAEGKVVVFGQSLGGAVAIQLVASERNRGLVHGLVLENTFTAMRKLIPSVMPPAKYLARLCHEIWASDTYLPLITDTPILFLSGRRDEIIPPSHMDQLYEICKSRSKIWRPLPNGTHNETIIEPGYFDAFAEFLKDHVLSK